VICTRERPGALARCLDSLLAQAYPDFRVLVVDNGSTDGSADAAEREFGARVIRNAQNRGFCAANNQGFVGARNEFIALLNNDAEAEPGWLAALVDCLEAHAEAGAATSRMLLAERPDLPPAVVDLLAEDPDAKVLKSVARTATLTDGQLRTMVARHGTRVVAAVARNPTCGTQLLRDLATHAPPVPKALQAVAGHPNADAAALQNCLQDRRARPIAARHPALPAATITQLLHDSDDRVVEAAAANPSLPSSTLEHLITAGPDDRHGDHRPW